MTRRAIAVIGAMAATGLVLSAGPAHAVKAPADGRPRAAEPLVPVTPPAAAQPWQPRMGAAVRFARGRRGRIAIAIRTPTRAWHWHANSTFPSASVLKAMLLVAYLSRPSVRFRALRASDRALLAPMIRRSANRPASRLIGSVGLPGLRRLARRVGMRRFTPVAGIWGASRITASDQARFFVRIDRFMSARHRAYAMTLLRTIVPEQRWGIARVRPPGWKLYFKGGWGSGTGGVENQVALLRRDNRRVSVAILTQHNGSHEYGKATLRGIALRLLAGLKRAEAVP